MDGYVTLDTRAFDKFISEQPSLLSKYDELCTEYDRIIADLMVDWKGRGADAFERDSQKVKTNIVGIQDVLKTMCDSLADCREIFAECDTSLGNANRNALQE